MFRAVVHVVETERYYRNHFTLGSKMINVIVIDILGKTAFVDCSVNCGPRIHHHSLQCCVCGLHMGLNVTYFI